MSDVASLVYQCQMGSGLAFSSFLILHLTTHASTHLGFAFANEFLANARAFYQNPLVEVVVIGSALVHIGAGMLRVFWRNQKSKKEVTSNISISLPIETTLHRWSGLALTVFFAGHFAATRLAPYLYDFVPVYSDLTFSLTKYPLVFYIYYPTLGVAGAYHLLYGTQKALKHFRSPANLPSNLRPGTTGFRIISSLAAGLMISSILAIGGNYFPVHIEHKDLLERIEGEVFGTFS